MRPQIAVQDEVRDARAEAGSVLLYLLDGRRQLIGSIRLKDPAAHTGFQALPDNLLRLHIGKNQYFLVWIVSQDLPCGVKAIQVWHADIQDQKIWFQLYALCGRFAAI